MQIPFLGPSYAGRSPNLDSSRCVNFFPELTQNPNAKSPIALIGTPGLALYYDFGDNLGQVRMQHVFNGLLFIVIGSGCYSMDSSRTVTGPLFQLATASGLISASDNGVQVEGVGGNQMLIVDGVNGYIWDIVANTVTVSSSFTGDSNLGVSNFPSSPSMVAYMDGYFIVSNSTMSFFVSDLYDGTSWSGLAVASANAASDTIMLPFNLSQELYLIKEYTTEIFFDNGTPTSQGCPFTRRSGAVLDFGTPSHMTVARVPGGVMMLGSVRTNDLPEFVGVILVAGYTPTVVSTEAITFRISRFNIADSFAYVYSDGGHIFYVLTFPTDNATFVYDVTTGMWHERSSYITGDKYQVNRHLASTYSKFNGLSIVSDYRSGKLYEMNINFLDDAGQPIVSFVVAPTITDKEETMENVFISRLIIDSETGVGTSDYVQDFGMIKYANGQFYADGTIFAGYYIRAADSQDPQADLSWSKDGGHTWSNDYQSSMGKVGEYGVRLYWRRLGRSRNRVFRLAMAEAVKKVLLNAYVEASI